MISGGIIKTQVLVVGAGPGGSVTACVLAEAGRDVVILEEGPDLRLDSKEEFTPQEMLQKYRGGGLTLTWGKPKVTYVEGRVLGGGSEVNSGLYHRTPENILERWSSEWRVLDCSARDLDPYFAQIETDLEVTLSQRTEPKAALKLKMGAEKMGWNSIEVPRWYSAKGRRSMSETYLPRAKTAGTRILSQTHVEHLKRRGLGWQAECRTSSGERFTVLSDQVFCAAGAIQTPALLRRSGVTHNIGKRLNLHPSVKVVAEFGEVINGPDMGVPARQIKEFAPDISMGCSISRPQHLALALMNHRELVPQIARRWTHMAAYYAMTLGEGRGGVDLLPMFKDPLVRYQMAPREFEYLRKGLRDLCQALLASGASAIYPSADGASAIRSERDLDSLNSISNSGLKPMTIHLFGSCPMGEDKSMAATNSFGEVFEHKGLHIADASLLCSAPGVNPQGTIMAFAKRNAEHFLNYK